MVISNRHGSKFGRTSSAGTRTMQRANGSVQCRSITRRCSQASTTTTPRQSRRNTWPRPPILKPARPPKPYHATATKNAQRCGEGGRGDAGKGRRGDAASSSQRSLIGISASPHLLFPRVSSSPRPRIPASSHLRISASPHLRIPASPPLRIPASPSPRLRLSASPRLRIPASPHPRVSASPHPRVPASPLPPHPPASPLPRVSSSSRLSASDGDNRDLAIVRQANHFFAIEHERFAGGDADM